MADDEFSLKGEVALVTGSGRGLGHAIAMRLAELGASVAIHDVSAAAPAEYGEFADLEGARAAIGRYGTQTCAVLGNIADETVVHDIAREVGSKLGPVTLLVNAAGGDIGARGGKPNPNDALHIKLEDIRALLDRNLVGTMLMCQAIVGDMVARRSGQHRLCRGPFRHVTGGGLLHDQGGDRALHPLPGLRNPSAQRARELREPGSHGDGAVPEDTPD
jgi:NAD(P)-dependent dehydrogenase (short-subunit alcohol dehydrogenase family)